MMTVNLGRCFLPPPLFLSLLILTKSNHFSARPLPPPPASGNWTPPSSRGQSSNSNATLPRTPTSPQLPKLPPIDSDKSSLPSLPGKFLFCFFIFFLVDEFWRA